MYDDICHGMTGTIPPHYQHQDRVYHRHGRELYDVAEGFFLCRMPDSGHPSSAAFQTIFPPFYSGG